MMISITIAPAMVTVMLSRLWKVFSRTQVTEVGDHVERAYTISVRTNARDSTTEPTLSMPIGDHQRRDEYDIESYCNRGNYSPYMKNPMFVKHIPITTTATK